MYSFSSRLWFNKHRIQKNGEVSLYLQAVLNGAHKEFPLKLKWPANKIDLVKGELLPRKKKDVEADDYNLIVQTEKAKHNEIYRLYRLRSAYLDIKILSRELGTFDLKESFIGYMSKQILYRYNIKETEHRTYLNHRCAQHLMKEFDSIWSYAELDLKFVKRFRVWLVNKGFEPGYVWSVMRTLKAYLRLACKEPMIFVNQDAVDFENPMPTWRTTFLDNEEIRRLMILLRAGGLKEIEEQVLRAFLFTCFTSLRISDVYRVNPKWRISDNTLHFIPKKNEKKRKWITIPIMPMANHFITNLAGSYFSLPSQVEYNRALEDLAMKADIKKKLTSHVGRHTFGYLFMTTIGNVKALQEILGHSKLETTERYAHLDEEYKFNAVNQIQAGFQDLIIKKRAAD